jgi:hypothetical protein
MKHEKVGYIYLHISDADEEQSTGINPIVISVIHAHKHRSVSWL